VSRRARILAYGSAGLLVVAGGLSGALVHGLTGDVLLIALEMIGLGGALLLVFLEIGLSEDREREKEQRAAREQPPEHPDTPRWPSLPRRPRRPD
jgi:hypothetical protein